MPFTCFAELAKIYLELKFKKKKIGEDWIKKWLLKVRQK